jgi:geranylgeranyl diphosphate synthase type II
MNTPQQITEIFEHHLAMINMPDEPQRLYAPIRYSLAEGGKRMRPVLAMLAYNIYADDIQTVLPAATAVEVFHNFTLLHDDIMDNAAMRRGRPSVFARWGSNVAILSGDVMMIEAYRHLQGVEGKHLPQVFECFNSMAARVCEGQQYDMDYETQPKVSVAEYMNMIELKTAALLVGSVVIGATIAGASEQDIQRLNNLFIVIFRHGGNDGVKVFFVCPFGAGNERKSRADGGKDQTDNNLIRHEPEPK